MFSMILLAIAGLDYKCLYADVGNIGRINCLENNSDLRQKIENDELNIPDTNPLPFGIIRAPHVFVGYDTFALNFSLKNYMMKHYQQRDLTTGRRVYNYRHSRAWRIFQNVLNISPEKTTSITTPCALVLQSTLSVSRTVKGPIVRYIKSSTYRVVILCKLIRMGPIVY